MELNNWMSRVKTGKLNPTTHYINNESGRNHAPNTRAGTTVQLLAKSRGRESNCDLELGREV